MSSVWAALLLAGVGCTSEKGPCEEAPDLDEGEGAIDAVITWADERLAPPLGSVFDIYVRVDGGERQDLRETFLNECERFVLPAGRWIIYGQMEDEALVGLDTGDWSCNGSDGTDLSAGELYEATVGMECGEIGPQI